MFKPKLSPEEIQTRREVFLDKVKKISRKIPEISHRLEEDEKEFKRFLGDMDDLRDIYAGFDNYDVPLHLVDAHQDDVSQVFYNSGTYQVVRNVVASFLSKRNYLTQAVGVTMTTSISHLKRLMRLLVNYTCRSKDIIEAVTQDTDFLSLLVKTLDAGHRAHLDKEISETQNEVIDFAVKILHNCVSLRRNIPRLRDVGSVEVLFPYLDSDDCRIQLTSLNTLARLVNEKEAKNLLKDHMVVFTLLIQRLDLAWQSSNHRDDWGHSVTGLISNLKELARTDTNKQALVDQGSLPRLVNILDSLYDYEVEATLNTLWLLSFDEDNKQKMVDEPNLVRRVWAKYNYFSSTAKIKTSSYGILWSLKEQLEMGVPEYIGIARKIEEQKTQADMRPAQRSQRQPPAGNFSYQGHVMISYNWAQQETILQICQKLKEDGIPVWIDVELMEGSMTETMAKAVEDSSIFLMAVSGRYKDSPNCRLEALYAQTLRKTIIPLMMEQDYTPDGWLGMIKGDKVHYDFSGKYSFDEKMSELLKAIKKNLPRRQPAQRH